MTSSTIIVVVALTACFGLLSWCAASARNEVAGASFFLLALLVLLLAMRFGLEQFW